MQLLGYILLAFLVLSVLHLSITLLALSLVLLLISGLVFRTRETLGLLAVFVLANLVATHPLPTLAVLGLLGILALLRGSPRQSDGGGNMPLLPPPNREDD